MITGKQQALIERQQYFALKNIYGFMHSYRQLLEMSGLKTLEERREEACVKFVRKTEANPRFSHWFPTRNTRSTRKGNTQEYIEFPARTDRRKQSPIYYYQRLLNTDRINYDVRKTNSTVPENTEEKNPL